MRPQVQKHLFGNGAPGDCHRTCVAMILNMDRDDVPHFMANCHPAMAWDDPAFAAAEDAEEAWLAQHGLTTVSIPFPGSMDPAIVIGQLGRTARSPVVLGCTSANGCDHSVVVFKGQLHDPSGAGVAGPMRDGAWWVTIYAVGPNWPLPHTTAPASVAIQED